MHAFAAFFALAATSSALPTLSSILQRSTTAAQDLCGTPDDSSVIDGTPWIVYNMMYNADQIEGSACTGYKGLVTGVDGEQKCSWSR